jgi:hypothetical protein
MTSIDDKIDMTVTNALVKCFKTSSHGLGGYCRVDANLKSDGAQFLRKFRCEIPGGLADEVALDFWPMLISVSLVGEKR